MSTQYPVLGTQYSVLSTAYSVLSIGYSILDTHSLRPSSLSPSCDDAPHHFPSRQCLHSRHHRGQPAQRLHLSHPAGKEHSLARVALQPLFAADPLVFQHPTAELRAAARAMPHLWSQILQPLLSRRAAHRVNFRRPLLSGSPGKHSWLQNVRPTGLSRAAAVDADLARMDGLCLSRDVCFLSNRGDLLRSRPA